MSELYSENKYNICLKSVSELNDIKNWSKNRPEDPVRVSAIKNYYTENYITMIPGILCLWKSENDLYIYDGVHRLKAASNEMKCIVKIHSGDESEIIQDFNCINKNVSLPSIYTSEDTIKKKICEDIVNRYCSRYSAFVSPSKSPRAPNFNRDIFIEMISDSGVDFTLPDICKKINRVLVSANDQAKDYVLKNNIKVPKKCINDSFYLFYIKNSIQDILCTMF